MIKKKTKRQKEVERKLSKENNKLRWFCVPTDFKTHNRLLKKGWYEKTGTFKLNNYAFVHDARLRGAKEIFRITDSDLIRIVRKFTKYNEHLY